MRRLIERMLANLVLSWTERCKRRRAEKEYREEEKAQLELGKKRKQVWGPDTPEANRGFNALFEAEPLEAFRHIYYEESAGSHYISFEYSSMEDLASLLESSFWQQSLGSVIPRQSKARWCATVPDWPAYWPQIPSATSRSGG